MEQEQKVEMQEPEQKVEETIDQEKLEVKEYPPLYIHQHKGTLTLRVIKAEITRE